MIQETIFNFATSQRRFVINDEDTLNFLEQMNNK